MFVQGHLSDDPPKQWDLVVVGFNVQDFRVTARDGSRALGEGSVWREDQFLGRLELRMVAAKESDGPLG